MSAEKILRNNNVISPNESKWVYVCGYCSRTFSSGQALGGHQNAHRFEHIDGIKTRHRCLPRSRQSYQMTIYPPQYQRRSNRDAGWTMSATSLRPGYPPMLAMEHGYTMSMYRYPRLGITRNEFQTPTSVPGLEMPMAATGNSLYQNHLKLIQQGLSRLSECHLPKKRDVFRKVRKAMHSEIEFAEEAEGGDEVVADRTDKKAAVELNLELCL